jgi:murein DD-endopeptidase MepM/ murein hydrolase activator NlpD
MKKASVLFAVVFCADAFTQAIHTLPTTEVYAVSCNIGCYTGHSGTDYATGGEGKNVVASADGVVETVSDTDAPNDPNITPPNSMGNYIVINHGVHNGVMIKTYYYHLKHNSFEVSNGQSVSRGRRIALSGNSGTSTGPHLHFEVKHDGISVDPYDPNNWLWTTNPPSLASQQQQPTDYLGLKQNNERDQRVIDFYNTHGGASTFGQVWGNPNSYLHLWPNNGDMWVQDFLKNLTNLSFYQKIKIWI